MSARKNPSNPQSASRGKRSSGSKSSQRFKQISNSTSQIVREAAGLLDEEIAAGVVAARQMQKRFQAERRIDPADFKEALNKFQSDAHEIVGLLNEQFNQLRSQENTELVNRLVSRTHDVVDLAVEVVNTSAEIANQLAQSGKKRDVRSGSKRAR